MSAAVELLSIPYDSARRGWRMGAGPQALLRAGLMQRLRALGDVELVPIEGEATADPVESAFDLAARTARVARAAVQGNRLPVVLTGNCIGTLGALAGLGAPPLLLWLDAHADLNTPDTSTSGFLDGMSAATCLVWCHAERSARIEGFAPLTASSLVLVGAREIDAPEQAAIAASDIRVIGSSDARAGALQFPNAGDTLYVHLDLDVLDASSVGRANSFACDGGLTADEVVDVIGTAATGRRLVGLTVSAYDPAADADGNVARAALDIITAVTALRG